MRKKIIGSTVGTPTSPQKMNNELKPVKTVNGHAPDENGNVEVIGNKGADGISPVISVSDIEGGHRVIITDKDGEKRVDIMDGATGAQGIQGEKGDKGDTGANGKDGSNGTNGKDGVSPSVNVSKFGKTTTITITDANGTKTATITDGADGADGSNGKDGENGKDGTSVTVKSVSESTADGGSNVVAFSNGTTLTVKNGSKGSQGEKGEQGIQSVQGEKGDKGDPYTLTDADKATIVQAVLNNMATEKWIFTLEDDSTVEKAVLLNA